MPLFDKHFTVEEANALLPELRRIIADIRTDIEGFERDKEGRQKSLQRIDTNGGGKKLEEIFDISQTIRDRVAEIGEMGVDVKDPRRGLLDFPAMHHGKEILLCWLVEEPSVRYWHTLEAGFTGRRSVDELEG